jgi:molybdate transport system substrate-binding protein
MNIQHMLVLKRLLKIFLICSFMGFNLIAYAGSMTIAAASDLKFALDETVKNFNKQFPQHDIKVIYGSSGKIYTHIQQGAPYDLYFSADISYPDLLKKEGLTSGPVTPHAVGRIVLWAPKGKIKAKDLSLEYLLSPSIKRIAIANPKHAPYGKRAEEALKSKGLWQSLQNKLIYGENISQTAQFVQTGNADIGIIALSLAMSQELIKNGHYILIPDQLHTPLEQGFVLTKRGEQNTAAQQFAAFMSSQEARQVMVKYGFVLPNEQ